jgi:hypothetical protein
MFVVVLTIIVVVFILLLFLRHRCPSGVLDLIAAHIDADGDVVRLQDPQGGAEQPHLLFGSFASFRRLWGVMIGL